MKQQNIRLWVILGVAAFVLIVGGVVWFSAQNSNHRSANGPVIDSSAIPNATPTPAVSGGPVPTDPSVDGNDALADTSRQSAALTAAITQFLTFNRNESPAARTARLTPLVAAGSPLLTAVPSIAKREKWGMVGFNAVITVNSADIVSIDGDTPDGKGYETSVFVTYTAVYSIPGQAQTVAGQGTWHSTVLKSGSPLPISLTQP